MSMEVKNTYNSYVNTYAGVTTGQTKATDEAKQSAAVKNASSTQQTSKDYLNNLRQKYPNINITVVDFKSKKQEESYMLSSSGGNNVAISSSIIEKMAKDPAMAAKYEKIIADIPNASKEMKEAVESRPGSTYIASGVKIDKDGKVTYWGVSSKTTEGPGTKEKMQKLLEEKRAKRKEQKKAEEARKEKIEAEEALEEKRETKKAEEKERLEVMLAKGDDPEDVIIRFGSDEADIIATEDMDDSAGSHINLSV